MAGKNTKVPEGTEGARLLTVRDSDKNVLMWEFLKKMAPGMAAVVRNKAELRQFGAEIGYESMQGQHELKKSILYVDFDPTPAEWVIEELIDFLDAKSPTTLRQDACTFVLPSGIPRLLISLTKWEDMLKAYGEDDASEDALIRLRHGLQNVARSKQEMDRPDELPGACLLTATLSEENVLTWALLKKMAPGIAAAVKGKADLAYFESRVGWVPVLGTRAMTKSIMFLDFDPKPSEWPIAELIDFLDPTLPTNIGSSNGSIRLPTGLPRLLISKYDNDEIDHLYSKVPGTSLAVRRKLTYRLYCATNSC